MKISIPFLALFFAVFFSLSASSEGAVLSKTCKNIDPSDKVKLGECLFNKETFEGNGRTCASCHPPENNFTIDPKFIKTLPAKDKLFVFEDLANFPGLKMCRAPGATPNGTKCTSDANCSGAEKCESLENGVLMRKYGLILENVDGLDKPGRMRSVPHTLSLNTSLTGAPFQGIGVPGTPAHNTGWSGDGTPGKLSNPPGGPGTGPFTGFCSNNSTLMCQGGNKAAADAVCGGANVCNGFGADGSIKAFAIGAVIQHATKDLRRRIGTDFRLPTEEELIAMEAYQRAQGRQADDPNISSISYNNAYVNEGRDQFFNGLNTRCNTCHSNLGATIPGVPFNLNFNTGAEAPTNPHFLEMVGAPKDGGFGGGVNGFCSNGRACSGADQASATASCSAVSPAPGGLPGPGGVCTLVENSFGDGSFSAPPLIEAADTAPYMHNNAVRTLEEAVAFYQSPNFSDGIGVERLALSPDQVGSIAAFLRTVNAVENIRLAKGLFDKAKQDGCSGKAVSLALADTEDAYQVLEGSELKLFGEAQNHLKKAYDIGKTIESQEELDFGFDLSGFGGFFGEPSCSFSDSKKIKKAIAKLEEARNLIVAP
jgi:cytochrome c peroxidase